MILLGSDVLSLESDRVIFELHSKNKPSEGEFEFLRPIVEMIHHLLQN